VLLKMLMNIGLSKMRGLLVMTIASISPSGREVPPGRIVPSKGKSAHAEVPSRRRRSIPKVLSLFFYRSQDLKYQKMGTGGGLGWPQPTRARLGGLARPRVLWSPGGLPDSYLLQYFYIFQDNSS